MYIKLHGYKTCPSGAYPCCSFRCIQNYIGIKLEKLQKEDDLLSILHGYKTDF